MKVDNILQSKGSATHRVSQTATINDTLKVLSEHNIGAVLVVDEKDHLVGILSERDIVRYLGRRGTSVLEMKVSECMTPKPYTCTMQASVDELLGQMTNERIRHMPVVENGKILGLVSIGDVVKRKIQEAEEEAASLREYIGG